MSDHDLSFSCSCGKVKGHLATMATSIGTRLTCSCADCRAVELFHNHPDPKDQGVDLFQVSADMIHIDQGQAHLKVLRLSPKGIFRWYAGCCGTPMFNGLKSAKLPFAAIRSSTLSTPDRLGKIRMRGFIQKRGQPARHKGAGGMLLRMVRFMLASRLSGRWRDTPFFDVETGQPISEPHVLTKEERSALYS